MRQQFSGVQVQLNKVDRTELQSSMQESDAPQGKVFDCEDNPTTTRDSHSTFHSFDDGTACEQIHYTSPYLAPRIDWNTIPESVQRQLKLPSEIAANEARSSAESTVEPVLPDEGGRHRLEREVQVKTQVESEDRCQSDSFPKQGCRNKLQPSEPTRQSNHTPSGMSELPPSSRNDANKSPAKQHKPLVVGRTKPQTSTMDASDPKASLNEEIKQNAETNTQTAAPTEGTSAPPSGKKKEKAPKQPKPPKAAPPTAPLSPALIDLRVGHILRAINHPNADSLYVSTVAMGDAEGTEHTQVDEETGKVVRTVCSGLNGLVPLEEMQNRKVVVVANLKPVNMRSIKSAAMVLAASPKAEEGADPHAADRVVELVTPPEGAEAGDPVYFEGWEYGEGKGPEKTLNPKKKQWEAIQPGFFTSEDLVVGFDAGQSEVEGDRKGELTVQGKGKCTVKTLKGAVVR
jgi:tRNA-binding EMAP/Myf-like protein